MPVSPVFYKNIKMRADNYTYTLLLGGIYLKIYSEASLARSEDIDRFLVNDKQMDTAVYVKAQRGTITLPEEVCGRDLLMEYYRKDNLYYATGRTEAVGDCCTIIYTPDFSEMVFYINEEKYPGMIRNINKVLQLLPVRRILAKYQAFLLHSSRVVAGGKALVFTAPSKTGKTTQARLWEQFENAIIVSNDRTLLRRQDGVFVTYGYPVDGSSPVFSNQRIPLGAIVILRQGKENRVERIKVSKAFRYLMAQTVADIWDVEELEILKLLWMDLLGQYPVYRLTCRADQEAVSCLKKQLKRDGVI